MTSNEILKADVLDIIFDNRNKQYGAYALRKYYNERLSIALAITLSSILFFIFFIGSSKKNTEIETNTPPEVVVHTGVVPEALIKKPEPLKHIEQQPRQMAQKQLTNFEMVDKNVSSIATIKDLQSAIISDINSTGQPSTSANIFPPTPTTTGTGEEKPQEKPKENFIPVERTPQFPGGNEAWLNFLNRNLHSPTDLEPGEKRIVRIKFDVSADGSITNFQIVQSAGSIFDNEVIRVLRKMPKWIPAIQNGKPASVSFTQPVTFMGVEE